MRNASAVETQLQWRERNSSGETATPIKSKAIVTTSLQKIRAVADVNRDVYIIGMSSTLVKTDDSRFAAESTAFRSFWMGGFECSTHRLPRRKAMRDFAGVRLDLIAATRHDEF